MGFEIDAIGANKNRKPRTMDLEIGTAGVHSP
jgi:hypothetical protein